MCSVVVSEIELQKGSSVRGFVRNEGDKTIEQVIVLLDLYSEGEYVNTRYDRISALLAGETRRIEIPVYPHEGITEARINDVITKPRRG